MQVSKDFVIDCDWIYTPKYNIGPFSGFGPEHIAKGSNTKSYLDFFHELFPGKKVTLTKSGRQAIALALSQLKLQKKDCVTILTTSGNSYISGCVTKEIERFCEWSMKIEENTKVLFINHEFGFPYRDLRVLKEKYPYTIIEDVAHGLFSQNEEKTVGTVGDYVICSLSKVFPMQMGGALLHSDDLQEEDVLSQPEFTYIQNNIEYYGSDKDHIITQRRKNYEYLKQSFKDIGADTFFSMQSDINPGIFMFTYDKIKDWNKLKEFMQSNGVESSVFYGESAYFIPVHQNLRKIDMDYFVQLVSHFIQHQN